MKTELLTKDANTVRSIREARIALGLTHSFAARQIGISVKYMRAIEDAQIAGDKLPTSKPTLYRIECELHMEPGCLTGDPAYRPNVRPLRRASAYRDRESPDYSRMPRMQEIDPVCHEYHVTGGRAFL